MSIRDDFFAALEAGAKWDVGVSIDRSNPLPLDSRSVFKSLTDAQTYAEGVFSYPGQVIAVVSEDNKVTVYAIDGNKALQEMGSGSGSAMLFLTNISALTTLGTPPTGVPNDLAVGQQAFVTEDKKIHFLTAIGTEGDVTTYTWEVQASDAPTWNGSATNIVGFETKTYSAYKALTQKDEDVLYFITDAGKIFKGTTDVTESVVKVETFPAAANAIDSKFYVGPAPTASAAGYEIRIKNGDAWETIRPGYYTDGANWASAESGQFATIGLIKKGIQETINAISLATVFTVETGTVKVGDGEGAVLTGVAHGITYDSSALKITIPQYGSEDLVVNIPKDKFVKSGAYYEDYPADNPTQHKVIVLEVEQGDPVIIPAASLVDIYTADNTDKNVKVTITDDNKISAYITLDPTAGNALTYSEAKGFMVNISGKMDKISGAAGDKIVVSTADGGVVESDKTIDSYALRVEGTSDNIMSFGASGAIKDSGKKVGSATLSETPDANTVATEAAVAEAFSWSTM